MSAEDRRLVLFDGSRRIAAGTELAVRAALLAAQPLSRALRVFDLQTGRPVDLDLRPVEAKPAVDQPRRGRPRLGVTAREVTLLPRHWDWLATQPGGASAALRRLVEQARKDGPDRDIQRRRTEAAYGFMVEMAGDAAGFEEASRALFAGDRGRLQALILGWPADIQAQILELIDGAATPDQ